ncbi:16677_t:CDS:10 [Funneliformis caledonium]|uniref:16677_t:CDS:1 n=1 Tax=Funneliformis caledonium TaxID=1117310 RepID=A0A9N8W5B5_9GLOM|nr:16677_t:CDS:10 [Funneliformis caledonium]
MSPEPTSVAALSRTSDLFASHCLLFPKEYGYTKSMQSTTDKRTRTSSPYLTLSSNNNNHSSTTSEAQDQDVRRIQRQCQGLNGIHNMNNSLSQPLHQSSSSVDVNRDRLGAEIHVERSSLDKERGSLDLLVTAASTLNIADSENSNTVTTSKTSPVASVVDLRLERKRLEHERQRHEQRQLFEERMKMLELQQLEEERDLLENHTLIVPAASASAPNTPPSLVTNDTRARSNTVPRLNNTSVGSLIPNATQFDSSHAAESLSVQHRSNSSSRSVPNSRRNSNESSHASREEKLNKTGKTFEHFEKELRASIGSMPQRRDVMSINASNSDNSIFPQFNGNFLLDEEGTTHPMSSSCVCRYLQMHTDDDKFPILVRRDSYPGMVCIGGFSYFLLCHLMMHSVIHLLCAYPIQKFQLSASSAALDLAPLPQSTSRHRALDSSDRKKLDNLTVDNNNISTAKQRVPKLSTSYSTPDLASATRLFGRRSANFNASTANDVLLEDDDQVNHPAQLPTVTSGDVSGSNVCRFYQQGYCQRGDRCSYSHTFNGLGQVNLNLPAQITGGFPGVSQPMNNNNNAFYNQYGISGIGGVNILPTTAGLNYNQNLALNVALNRNMNLMQASNVGLSKMSQKRMSGDLEVNRFAGVMLEDLVGEIYPLCKDQHGCRYLQKKLEEKNEQYIGMIFNEVFSHFVELMTDPFGNYLCQKLLEYCNDNQRTIIIETVAPELVNISLNMHGTRAVQKMIEFLSTPQQIHPNYALKKQICLVIVALNPNVVTLIKDLNGNHVIQKCLNRLSSEDNQFIYNAVSKNCIEVATHRHGCCVLQRCIDHASEAQKVQLVTEITYHALTLVQDPFGNYVVQYVLDLGDSRFTDALIRKFISNVCGLSVQKFSSNVMEKCIRVAEPDTRKFLIDEMLNKNRLDKLLRDSYANYVVQTALDYADPLQRASLVDCIRPLLPAIRNTPYGKRIQGKLHREVMQLNSLNMLRIPLHGLGNLGNFTGNFGGSMGGGLIGMNDYQTPSYHYI